MAGDTPEDVARLDPNIIHAVHVCDKTQELEFPLIAGALRDMMKVLACGLPAARVS